ncbi:AAA family ATPase [Sphingobacterium sp. Mn56C]|uniref:AAA family ATPase n=1 Tax=Sphingobacterium sp. Mn56C TaxID=3395261 RepID=UPI003BBA1D79
MGIKYQNLIYHNGIAVRNILAKNAPEAYKKCFELLFDENIGLHERILAFQANVAELYQSLGNELHHHHDERTIATFLSFKYPDRYPLYKDSFYSAYCKKLRVKSAPKNKKYEHYIQLLKDFIINVIEKDEELLAIKSDFLTTECYHDANHLIFAQDILYQAFRAMDKVEMLEDEQDGIQDKIADIKMEQPLNQILYGPPGTGKTYNTINKAVSIANPSFDLSLDRRIIKAEYQRLVKSGQIVFTTFHQSMSYEDFVEGIKPVLDSDNNEGKISYTIDDGIFKSICHQASLKEVYKDNSIDWENKDYFKLSLGGVSRPDVHEYCLDNNVIALGYGGENDLSGLCKISNWNEFKNKFSEQNPEEFNESTYSAQATFTFLRIKKGDVVVISRGNKIVDAVGIVDGDYYFDDNLSIDYKHFRKVKWLSTRMNYNPDFFLDINISQMTIYEFYKHNVKINAFKELFSTTKSIEPSLKPHILIIDEINRGNVSAIFGELITLIEESKRAGKEEVLEVILPYSKKKFSVPSNLYIIGTMNTADRSVEALDTALRRRFVFEEMLPKPDLEELDYEVCGYKASAILKRINLRIEKLVDRDHCIGHAYFIGKNEETIIDSFYKNIIPLLQEYFFGDYGKIGLVLGSGFVQPMDSKDDIFASFDYDYREDLASRMIYQIIDYRTYDENGEGFKAALDLLMR